MRMASVVGLALALGSCGDGGSGGTPAGPQVAVWISSSTPGLPLDLSGYGAASLLMDSRYNVTWSGTAPVVNDGAPGVTGSFVSAYPPGLTRAQHLATYGSGSPASDAILSDPVKLGDTLAVHYKAVSDRYGGVDIDVENFDKALHIADYATFIRRLRAGIGGTVPLTITVQISWSKAPEVLALLSDGTASVMNVMYYDYHGPWTAPGPVAPYDRVAKHVDELLAAGCPPSKLRMGVPAYHYDWRTDVAHPDIPTTLGGSSASALDKAVTIATPSQSVSAGQKVAVNPQLTVQRTWDVVTKEVVFQYRDSGGNPRIVHGPTGASTAFKVELAASRGLNGVCVWNWRHMSAYPAFQEVLHRCRSGLPGGASDPSGTEFLLTWTASGGALSATVTNGSGVEWTAPASPGSYTVTATTGDGGGLTAQSAVTFTVIP